MKKRYPNVWKRPLAVEPWMTPKTLLRQFEAARFLGTTREVLRRMALNDSGPTRSSGYEGKGIWYRVSDLVIWRVQIIGEGPLTEMGVWHWWARQGWNLEDGRKPPRPRQGRPKGLRVRHWRQRRRQALRLIGLKAEVLVAAARCGRASEWLPIIRS